MKNHYKIHEQNKILPNTNKNQIKTTTAEPPVFKTEILYWLQSDFDEFDFGPKPTLLASDRMTRSTKKDMVLLSFLTAKIYFDW
jgi:hypothetical protein